MIQYIQILRFAAAMWVALYHAKYSAFFPQLPQALRIFIDGGYAGVDIFFVISGVIMALVTQDSPRGIRHAGQFVLMRFARIYTGWWPVMAITVGMFVWLNALLPQTNLWSSAFLYFSNSSLHVSSVIWTLMYELYFYLIIGLSLLLVNWLGLIGVALGTLIPSVIIHCVYLRESMRHLQVPVSQFLWSSFGPNLVPVVLTLAYLLWFKQQWPLVGWPPLLLSIASASVLYLFLYLAIGAADDRRALLALLLRHRNWN